MNTIFFVSRSSATGTIIFGFNLNNRKTNSNGITVNNTRNVRINNNNITANNLAIYINKSSDINLTNNNVQKSDAGV